MHLEDAVMKENYARRNMKLFTLIYHQKLLEPTCILPLPSFSVLLIERKQEEHSTKDCIDRNAKTTLQHLHQGTALN